MNCTFPYFLTQIPNFPLGIHKLCFERLDRRVKTVSLNIKKFSSKEDNPDLVKGNEFNAIADRLRILREDLNRVSENFEQMQERELTHQQMLLSGDSSVRLFTIFKIAVIVIMSFLQGYLIASFFSNTQKSRLPLRSVTTL